MLKIKAVKLNLLIFNSVNLCFYFTILFFKKYKKINVKNQPNNSFFFLSLKLTVNELVESIIKITFEK